ncbi:MAG: hypothetical protein E5X86_36020, partial [Mesorhizobium sp.]
MGALRIQADFAGGNWGGLFSFQAGAQASLQSGLLALWAGSATVEAKRSSDELAQAAAEPTGTLRIAAPNDYGTSAVVPVVAAFSARYPACRVELTLGDETIDLASGGMDVAIRVGWLADSSL